MKLDLPFFSQFSIILAALQSIVSHRIHVIHNQERDSMGIYAHICSIEHHELYASHFQVVTARTAGCARSMGSADVAPAGKGRTVARRFVVPGAGTEAFVPALESATAQTIIRDPYAKPVSTQDKVPACRYS